MGDYFKNPPQPLKLSRIFKDMDRTDFRYVYGPVSSRRLGRSLGVDLVPFKTCSYDCIYCQIGHTTARTMERKEYVNIDRVLSQVSEKLEKAEKPDFISLAGSGEPTLNSQTGYLIKEIKKMTDIPVTVLTNGSLLWMEEVREDLMKADIVLPSLDIGDENTFQIVNRPCSGIPFEKMVKGIQEFSKIFKGEIWLEVLLLEGITSEPSDVKKIAGFAKTINPDRIQLNTAYRPAVEKTAVPVSVEKMNILKDMFSGRVEIIADETLVNRQIHKHDPVKDDEILSLLGRRPCTASDISKGLEIHVNEITKQLEALVKKGSLKTIVQEGLPYYTIS